MPWRQRATARGGARLPAGFIVPAQPTLVPAAPSGTGWIHELKHDGWRLLARKDGPRVRLWTRQASDVTDRFTGIASAISRLPVDCAVLDGEAVVLRADGHSDFHALRGRAGGAAAILIAFDLLSFAGDDLRKLPVQARRDRLARLIRGHDGILFSQEIEGDGPTIFEHACRFGAEGIISKRVGSLYRSGRVNCWRKIKFAGFVRR